jgi:serine/threonine protein kinase
VRAAPAAATATTAGPRDPFVGRLINDKYLVVARIGCGGFGLVHRARQQQHGVDLGLVVLKFLHPELVENASIRRRFVNEARAARLVASPHVVKVFELDEAASGVDVDATRVQFIAMEHLEGERLADRLAGGQMPPATALRVARQMAQALEACHATGVVHRDLKPENVLLLDEASEEPRSSR